MKNDSIKPETSESASAAPVRVQPVVRPRPRRNDDTIIYEAAKQLAPKVLEWLNDETEPLSEIESDLVKAIKYNDDGYEVARSLDSQYSPDAALVEILDEVGWEKSKALKKAEAEWVRLNDLQAIPLETKVRWPRKPEAGVGIVTANHPDGKSGNAGRFC